MSGKRRKSSEPSETPQQRGRRKVSAFFKILVILTAACGVLVGGGFYLLRSIKPIEIAPPAPAAGCKMTEAGRKTGLEIEQAANAATIGGVAFAKDLPDHAVVIAYATVWQESKFHNIDFGDRDSVGLFQQRPSQEWGRVDQLMDPVYASGRFYDELADVPGYRDIPVYEAAQAVQRSADGFAYDDHEPKSRGMAKAFTGQEGAALSCWFKKQEAAETDVAGAREEMTRIFGIDPGTLPVADPPATGDPGQAMALWAVANAKDYGLTSVTYGDQRWTAAKGRDGWVRTADVAPEGQILLK
ncbi:hypothetical protein [Murinocardiopsis flavida]|uniref:hypothetical protein n=1 Tax=Murinocardiopsis flavida TaxID=645275 RepID=UPI000D0D4D80|nr:hypothetical protein [Murinocardiopsis flavida]